MTNLSLSESAEAANGPFELIRGNYKPEDALEILSHLIQEKINFHTLKNFSQVVRFDSKDEFSSVRIEELKKSRQAIKVLVDNAKKQGKMLSVKSNIIVELI